MRSEFGSSKASKWMWRAGWALTVLPAAVLVMSSVMKLQQPPQVVETFVGKFGYPESALIAIGVVELLCAAVYLIPQTAVLGAVLLTGYLGGAVSTHVRADESFLAPLLVGMVVWLGLFLRDARLRELLPLRKLPPATGTAAAPHRAEVAEAH